MSVNEAQGPQGPQGPDEKVSVSWLILQRLDDLKGQIVALETRVVALETRIDDVRQDMNRRFEAVDRRFEAMDHRLEGQARLWQWTMGIMAALVISAIVKLFVPGA
jgi:hypothetical protein